MQRTSPRSRPEAAAAPALHLDRERVAYHLRTADGWSDLQARLQPLGLEVDRRGQNLVLTNGGRAEVRLADVARDTSARQLELRLGAFDVWRGQVTEFQERLREATATQLQIRQLDHTWQRTTGLAARLEQRLQVRDSTQLERARLDDRLDGLLTKIYRPADLDHARNRLAELRQDLGDHRALALLEQQPTELGRLRGASLPLGIETPGRVQARQALDETRHVLAKLGENQLYGRTLDALTTRTPDRLTKLRDHAHTIAHHRFDLTTQKELGLERIGELAKVLGPKGVEAVAEKVARGLPDPAAGRAAGAAAGKVASAGLVAKTSAALSIVKAAVEYVERAGERER
ncbi:MAG: hypothetical protein SF066_10985 [Thermoanaerobaculia bacterium]|nr:hypothetical protein [Thermoanaerobaculia bacterium]